MRWEAMQRINPLGVRGAGIGRAAWLAACCWALAPALAGCGEELDFNRDVRPLLSDKCFACHGPDESRREADLRLDQRQAAVDAGVLTPGNPDASELWRRVNSDDDSERMPPPEAAKSLTARDKRILRDWIAQGAGYETHWAFLSPQRAAPPASAATSPLDAFILRRLQQAGLSASPPADPLLLIRRAYLDVTGLPPSPEEADYWLRHLLEVPAIQEARWSELVDSLLASQHYGERWGQLWLDAARYADSDGFEKDKPRFVWAYRDWVIQAFNRDLPYNRFLIEQIAGDLLPAASEDQVIATGYLRNSMINEEGGIDPEQFRMEAMFDRMDAIGKGVLGLTIQCAQCHSHKFDPLTQREYYRMFAFLNNCHEANVAAYTRPERERRDQLLAEIRRLEAELQADAPDWRRRMRDWEESALAEALPQWNILRPEEDASGGQKHYVLEDASVLAAGYAPTRHETAFHVQAPAGRITAFRLELLNDPNLPKGGPGRSVEGLCALTEFRVSVAPSDAPGESRTVEFASATASVNPEEAPLDSLFDDRTKKERVTGPIAFALDGKDETAWGIDRGPGRSNVAEQAVFVLQEPLESSSPVRLTFHLRQMHGGWNSDDNQNNNLGRFRFSCTDAAAPLADPLPAEVRGVLNTAPKDRTPEQAQRVFSYWRTLVPEWSETNARIEELWRQHPRGTTQLVLQEREQPRTTAVLERGSFLHPGEPVTPGGPAFLHALDRAEAEGPLNRLDFARWLASEHSPTTARSFVNRVWQAYFGVGLVETPEDLGVQSPPPSHPELLDFLAWEFMESGWSMKQLHRLILNSATYRQASDWPTGERAKAVSQLDPDNRLLWRYPRRRASAESVRDIALAVSGLLDRRLGGPSVHPPAPDFLFQPPASYGPKTWAESTGGDRYRRSLYTFRFRSTPYPVLQNFDAPPGEAACVRRPRSNTPLQALTTLNQITFLEAARALARRTLASPANDDAERARLAFRRCLTRPPSDQETDELVTLLREQRAHLADPNRLEQARQLAGGTASEPDASVVEAAAWTVVCRVLLNLDETITLH